MGEFPGFDKKLPGRNPPMFQGDRSDQKRVLFFFLPHDLVRP